MVIKKAVTNSGPIIHLSEIGYFDLLKIVQKLYTPKTVKKEINRKNAPGKNELEKAKWIIIKDLNEKDKEKAQLISKDFGIEQTDSETILLALNMNINLIFSDDLNMREVAELHGLEVHGTAGILARAYREGLLDYEEVKEAVNKLYKESSLYITQRVYRIVLDLIDFYQKKLI